MYFYRSLSLLGTFYILRLYIIRLLRAEYWFAVHRTRYLPDGRARIPERSS